MTFASGITVISSLLIKLQVVVSQAQKTPTPQTPLSLGAPSLPFSCLVDGIHPLGSVTLRIFIQITPLLSVSDHYFRNPLCPTSPNILSELHPVCIGSLLISNVPPTRHFMGESSNYLLFFSSQKPTIPRCSSLSSPPPRLYSYYPNVLTVTPPSNSRYLLWVIVWLSLLI